MTDSDSSLSVEHRDCAFLNSSVLLCLKMTLKVQFFINPSPIQLGVKLY